jgi:hypothetical protein
MRKLANKVKNFVRKGRNVVKGGLQYMASDNYFVSYPKCGRTWTRYFLAKYMENLCGREFDIEFDNLIQKSSCDRMLVYTHAQYEEDTLDQTRQKLIDLKNKNIINLVRDPRDVMVSLYFQLTKRNPKDFLSEGISMEKFVRVKQCGIERLVDFMNLWYMNRNLFADYTQLTYESLQEEPEKEFAKFIRALGLPLDPNILTKAIEESSFDNMRKKEKQKDTTELKPGDEQDEESYKTRRGKVGGYEDYLDQETVEFIDRIIDEKLHPDFDY